MTDTESTNVIPLQPVRPLDEAAALEWLRAQPGGRTDLPAAELARRWGWQRYNVSRRLQRWRKDGLVAQQGRFLVAVDIKPPEVATTEVQHIEIATEPVTQADRSVAVRNAAQNAATVAAPPSGYITGCLCLLSRRRPTWWAPPRPTFRSRLALIGVITQLTL
jgi:MarR family